MPRPPWRTPPMSQRCSSSEQIWTPSVRGDVYQIHLAGKKNVQRGHRFAIVVQSSRLNLSTTVIVPTSTAARPGLHRPEIDWDGTTTYALAEQVTALSLIHISEPTRPY